MQRKRFFSGESHCDLPMLSSSSAAACNTSGSVRSPPTSSNSFDFGRLLPNRASSLPTFHPNASCGRSSLSPKSSSRRIANGLFSSHPSESYLLNHANNSNNNNIACGSGSGSGSNNHPYGMLNPGSSQSASFISTINCKWAWNCLIVSGMVVLTLVTFACNNQNNLLRQELRFKETETMMHMDHAHSLERRVSQMRGETQHLYNRIEELEHPPQTQEELNIQRKVFHLQQYHQQVNRGIQQDAQRSLRER